MISAVNPTSSGRGGSTYAAAGRPTAVTGAFSSPGTAAGTPPGVPSSAIIEGRNNRGSNIRVPYARLVPMHSRENRHANDPKDNRLVTVNGTPHLEYDGLRQGELAWILGRRFKTVGGGAGPGGPTNGLEELGETQRYAHQAYAGLGSGVDRMQRLASTAWVQALVEQKMKNTTINIHEIDMYSDYAKTMDSGIAQFADYLGGASPLHTPDIAWWRAQLEQTTKISEAQLSVGYTGTASPNEGRRLQGINIVGTGPFLRGIQVDSKIVRFNERGIKSADVTATAPEDMPRNVGDSIAFAALETELRRRNLMDWTPDGIVLSKLDSPTDEPMKSTELDARQAQLFNIGVQGPSITTSWTSDVRDHKLEVQPMDKVFMCLVANLSYRVQKNGNQALDELRKKQQLVLKAMIALKKAIKAGGNGRTERTSLKTAIENAKSEATKYFGAINNPALVPEYQRLQNQVGIQKQALDSMKQGGASASQIASKQADYDATVNELNALWKPATKDDVATIESRSLRVRKNIRPPTQAILSDFRWIRTTSSHMTNFSHYRPGDGGSRCGLKLGKHTGNSLDYSGLAEVIVGGWCIGTVIDSAASRSTIGFQTVKSHPTSMAINLNVNVQWWSGDKLYKNYMDTGGQVMIRGMKRPADVVSGVSVTRPMPKEDNDVLPSNAGSEAAPAVGSNADGEAIEDDLPPMEEDWRSVRQRTDAVGPEVGAAAADAAGLSAFATEAGGSRVRQGASRRA